MAKITAGRLSGFASKVLVFFESDLFLKIIFGWFAFQAVYIALSTTFGIPPDEKFHYFYSQLFAHSGWSPIINNQSGYYFLGEVVKSPFFLYHYLLSLPLHLFYNSAYSVQILRLINVALGCLTLLILVKICDFLRLPKLVRNISLLMLANTLMFVFLSASISYDNLFNLVTISSVYLLLLNLDAVTMFRFLTLLSLLVAGMLIKVTFLPIALIVPVILIVKYRSTLIKQLRAIINTAGVSKKTNIAIGLLLAVLLGLFVQRYVANIASYGSYAPACTKVQTLQQCEQNAPFVRAETLAKTKHRLASNNPIFYLSNWSKLMLKRIYGIFAHKIVDPTGMILVWVSLFFIAGGLATLLGLFRGDRKLLVLILVTVFYAAALIYNNFTTYKSSGILSFAVQGRYLFAVLPLLYVVLNYYLLKLLTNVHWKLTYVLLTLLIFVFNCFPIYLSRTGQVWHQKISASG